MTFDTDFIIILSTSHKHTCLSLFLSTNTCKKLVAIITQTFKENVNKPFLLPPPPKKKVTVFCGIHIFFSCLFVINVIFLY